MSAQKVMLGTLTGVLAGLAIGLLVAPASGSETRHMIADKASALKRRWQRFTGAASDDLDELKEVFEQEITGLKDDVRSRVLELLNAAKASGNNLREQIKQ